MACLDTKNSSFMALKFVNWRTSSSRTQIATIPHTDRVISRTEISIEILTTQICTKNDEGRWDPSST